MFPSRQNQSSLNPISSPCHIYNLLPLPFAASLKNFGDKTANLFSKKKDEAEKLANDKAVEAQKLAEEQAKKVGQSVQQTKGEAEQLAASTGEF